MRIKSPRELHRRAWKRVVDSRQAATESMVYRNKKFGTVRRGAIIRTLAIWACTIAWAFLPDPWGTFALLPVFVYAYKGADEIFTSAMSYKMGWFVGRVDMLQSIQDNVRSTSDGRYFVGVMDALDETSERNMFAGENLGIGKPALCEEPADDEEGGAGD